MSKSNKYTEGPWAIDRDSDRDDQGKGYTWIVSTSEDEAIAMVSANLYPDEIFKFNSANANLIAAAPDLLDALEKLLHDTTSLCHSTDEADFPLELAEYWTSYMEPLLKKAIAKAKGINND